MKIRVITDSAADLPEGYREKFNVGIVPHYVHFKDRTIKLGTDITVKDYYNLLKKMDTLPGNSTPTPGDFEEMYIQSFKEENYDHLIYIAVSDHLTATVNAARVARKKYQDKITIINSQSASGVQGLLIMAAHKMLNKGFSISQITEKLEELIEKYILDVGFYTLENVYKSGRIKSKFILNLTKFIKIKPIAYMERPGKLVSKLPGLFFGTHMEKRLVDLVLKNAKKETTYELLISHVENFKGAKRVESKLKSKLNLSESYITNASPIIGTNTGEGTIIVSLIPFLSI
ncbi:MAG: DegV family protein [Candidatus Heimdallarchaeaceae archaeon]